MDQQRIIANLEARANVAGLAMGEVCRRANVHPTTFSRWKLSAKNPTPVGATLGSLAKIERALDAITPRSTPIEQKEAA